MPISAELIRVIRAQYLLDWNGFHGAPHWARVRINGLLLAEETGANIRVIEYFAFLHDSCRQDEGSDFDHGPRAVRFIQSIRRSHIDLNDHEFDLLTAAVGGHTMESETDDITIASCWDADRLDLIRVGIVPDPRRLLTNVAKRAEVIEAANERAERWVRSGHLD